MNSLPQANPGRRLQTIICLLAGIAAAFFTAYKAWVMSFTFDESATWLGWMVFSPWIVVTNTYPNAGNHIINTLYMKFCSAYIGDSEFALRALTWLSHIVYIWICFKLMQRLKHSWLMVPGFILLLANPYLLDYFSLARGYGMALSMMTVSIYGFVVYMQNRVQRWQALSLLAAILATLSNFSWLNYFLAIVGALVVFHFISTRQSGAKAGTFFRSLLSIVMACCLLFLVAFWPIRQLYITHNFFFGGNTGFWSDTILDLVKDSLYVPSAEIYAKPLFISLVLVFASAVVFLLIKLVKGRFQNIQNPAYYLLLILLILGLSLEVQHLLLGTLFLTGRTALMFIPLFIAFIFFVLDELPNGLFFSFTVKPLSTVFALSAVVYTALVVNPKGTLDFYYDSNTRSMVETIDKNMPATARKPDGTILKEPWIYIPTTDFYLQTKKMNWVKKLDMYAKFDTIPPDYYYMKNVDDNDRAQFKREHRTIIADYPDTHTSLVKWK